MAERWCCLYQQQVVGHRIQSLEQIPLPLFTVNAGKVVLRQKYPLFKVFPSYNGQWQLHYNFLSHQFAMHCWCNQGESLSKTHFIRHQCSWHISRLNPSCHDQPDGENLVR
jgi:hypothetical protein